MKYYSEHCKEYIDNTQNANMSSLYVFFEKYLKNKNSRIMDLGFGSGRDSLYFISKGFNVLSTDPTKEFCDCGKKLGLQVKCEKAENMDYDNEFDGIWACASLLHVESKNLNDVFKRCNKALKKQGVIYCSFKYGDFEGVRNERYFVDLNEETINEYLKDTGFEIIDMIITSDVRPDRDEKWLNVILLKQ